jgi:hypothetical protein
MADIITTKTMTVKTLDGQSEETITTNYVSRLINNILFINRIVVDEEGNNKEVLVMEQPWKCNPDGSRSNWQGEEDAEQWLESVKDFML